MPVPECRWFAECHRPSVATVEHPTVGDVPICQRHLSWLTEDTPGEVPATKMIPPLVAVHHHRLSQRLRDMLALADEALGDEPE